jgi:regulator of protease activity HflC (stomatin/prohibitin superfamily)
VRRNVLPQDITPKVFERQKTDRNALAEHTRASGKAKADGIRSEAESIRGRMLAFVDKRANQIRTKGKEEAAKFYDVFRKDEKLAIELLHIQAIEQMLQRNTTLVLDAEDVFSSFIRKLKERATLDSLSTKGGTGE